MSSYSGTNKICPHIAFSVSVKKHVHERYLNIMNNKQTLNIFSKLFAMKYGEPKRRQLTLILYTALKS